MMPQFDFYGTWDDSIAVLRRLFEYDSIRVVHDAGIWQEPCPHYFYSLTDELLCLLEQRPFLFIYGQFSRFAPRFVRQDAGLNAGTYYLAINEGGPGLELGLPLCRKTAETIELGSRFLSCPPAFLNPETQTWEKPSSEVRSAFHDMRSIMKKCLRRTKLNQVVYIGSEALELLVSGQATITDRGV